MSRSLIVYAGLYGGSAALVRLFGFGVFLWLARSLSVEGYAEWGLLYALQQAIATFAFAGIVEAVVGTLKEHPTPELRRGLFATTNGAFAVTAVCTAAFACAVWAAVLQPSGARGLTLVSVIASGTLMAFAALRSQVVRLDERHTLSLAFGSAAPFCSLSGGGLAFVMYGTPASYFWGSTVGVAAALVILRIAEGAEKTEPASTALVRRILLRAVPFVLVAVLGWLSGYGNNYIIHLVFEAGEIGRFTFLLSLTSMMLLVSGALNQVWSPRFYRLMQSRDVVEVEEKNRRFFRALAVVLGAVGGLVVTIFPVSMRLLGRNLVAYEGMALELALLFAGYVVLTPWWQSQNHFLFHGEGPAVLKLTILTSSAGIALLFALMWLFGPFGIYLGFLTQMILRAGGIAIAARRRWPVRVTMEGIGVGLALLGAGLLLSSRAPGPAVGIYVAVLLAALAPFFHRDIKGMLQA